MFLQVFQRELDSFGGFKPVHPKAREVADDNDLRQIPLGQAGEIRECLSQRGVQVFATRLLFDQQHAGPEQIDKAVCSGFGAGQLFHGMLKGGDALVGDAEDFKEINPERLALAVFMGRVGPGAAEGERAGFDFVPG